MTSPTSSDSPQRGLRVGLVFETFDTYAPQPGDPADFDVEFEPEATVDLLCAALAHLGCEPVKLGGPFDLLEQVGKGGLEGIDVALNIAEGRGSRNREAFAPVLLELARVPALGSDALTLSLSLDKAWTHRMVEAEGVRVPAHCVLDSAAAAAAFETSAVFPLFVKPRWEGTSKGIRESSKVSDRDELVAEVARIVREYRQPALVETFLSGAEYTVTVVGNAPARALPVLQRALEEQTRIGLHALEGASSGRDSGDHSSAYAYCSPGTLTAELEAELQRQALLAYDAIECLDFARADFRLDDAGVPHFLEINPLPTFAPDGTFGILAELAGRPAAEYLADILAVGLTRLELAESRSNT